MNSSLQRAFDRPVTGPVTTRLWVVRTAQQRTNVVPRREVRVRIPLDAVK
jgi:hypothetical protein